MIPGVNATIDSYRLVTASNKDTYSASKTLDTVECYLVQADKKIAIILDLPAFRTFQIFLDGDVDIEISDKIVDQDSNTYIVKETQKFINNDDVENHTEAVLVKVFDGT